MRSTGLFSLTVLICLTGSLAEAKEPGLAGTEALFQGTKKLTKVGVPGPLSVFRERTEVIALGRSQGVSCPLVVAANYGRGRVLAFGHGGYLGRDSIAQNSVFMTQALRWLGKNQKIIKVAARTGDLSELCQSQKMTFQWHKKLEDFNLQHWNVVVINPRNNDSEALYKKLRAYVREGGSLMVAGLGWGWLQLNRGKSLATEHPANRLCRPFGVAWGLGYMDRIEPLSIKDPRRRMGKADWALSQFEDSKARAKLPKPALQQGCVMLMQCIYALPENHTFVRRLRTLLGSVSVRIDAKAPLTWRRPLARLKCLMDQESQQSWAASPSAADFPGAVPDGVARISSSVVTTGVRGWQSTGLYAAPGQDLVIDCKNFKGCAVRIGCHSDELWHKDKWRRHPEISRRFELTAARQTVGHSFGGLIYIECGHKGRALKISGAVAAPRFVLGQTPVGLWKAWLRRNPGPWAELESGKIIVTLPSKYVRSLEDPEALMKAWDRVLDCYAALGQRPLPDRPERIVADRQISAGYMHSGYPIMIHMDQAKNLVDRALILGEGKKTLWGFWHELGHNHQRPEWTFRGTVEVTCNLFTLYVLNKISGIEPSKHVRFKAMLTKARAFWKRGAPFKDWQRDPFLALYMYVQVQAEFGWGVFEKVFAEVRDLKLAERPRTDADKRDQWLVRLSKACGRDLGPFFKIWGVPVRDKARAACKQWPVWLPETMKALASKEKSK